MRADGHFRWGSVMYGYLVYDTAFTVAFYGAVGSLSFLVHHALGLACCCFGLYFNKCAADTSPFFRRSSEMTAAYKHAQALLDRQS